ncbi:Rieske (2Fe-2S) protein [Acidihalobacter prosperus]|uniref:Ubiquinol-cytochrome C reductase iron-sulfur subunit n=1 Tax=Acidihalobacter prosperus TaxID=160660 RepID=A0A1A6C878_9GAMM|nr:hypothetical protein [Acidihalobacter prosperus]OBS10772.1 Ubiquinol-cytochrome C reductase iron-sulfur subunit [Acidihalobacter prosperus]
MNEWERSYTNPRRRLYLRLTVKLLFALLLAAGLYVMSASLFVAHHAAMPATRVDLTGIAPGTLRVVEWDHRRILVLHRTRTMIATLRAVPRARLYDADSARDGLPAALRNPLRSRRPAWFVAYDYGTTYGCALTLDPATAAGGLRDRCGGTRYDTAGRVYAGQDAQRNLSIPPYRFEGPDTLVIGE